MSFKDDWPKIDRVEGWLFKNEASMLYRLASRSKGPIIEIGSWKGRSSVCLGYGAINNPLYPPVICIDPFTGSIEHRANNKYVDTYREFLANIKRNGLEGRVYPYRRTSRNAFERYDNGGKIGLLFIDGSHEYEDVKFDFDAWSPLVLNGGWIAMHDMDWPGPRKVAEESINTLEFRIARKPISTMLLMRRYHDPIR